MSSSTASATATASASTLPNSFDSVFDGSTGSALKTTVTLNSLLAAIAAAAASSGAQLLIFYLLRLRLTRIYRPKTFMVAERQRVPLPPGGFWQWIIPVFTMPNATVINKCGLDAYFFLRYLRMLLKIFIPMAMVILPILLPINRLSGPASTATVAGPATLGWQNINPAHVQRTWAHLILAILVIVWVCYVLFSELRGYIRIRQAYLTSPQHRIRASATTVLVSGIPRKWLSVEALNGLYDVFPGGIRNIWINRDYSALLVKVKLRNKMAKKLEGAETDLVKKCLKSHQKREAEKAKKEGHKMTKEEKKNLDAQRDEDAQLIAAGEGISSGDPHQMAQDIHDAAGDIRDDDASSSTADDDKANAGRKRTAPLRFVGKGVGAFGKGLQAIGHKGKDAVGDIAVDLNYGLTKTNNAIGNANQGAFALNGDEPDESLRQEQRRADLLLEQLQRSATHGSQKHGHDNAVQGTDAPHSLGDVSPASGKSEHSTEAIAGRDGAADMHDTFDGSREDDPKTGYISRTVTKVKTWRKEAPIPFPSPQPKLSTSDEYPLTDLGSGHNDLPVPRGPPEHQQAVYKPWWAFWRSSNDAHQLPEPAYPLATNTSYDEDQDGEAEWMKYIETKDRDTMRLPVASWMPALPLMGEQVDKIYHLRKELARLNAEIEYDQEHSDRYPLMNSAFIQFNHQVAAHMACQAVSHHMPQHMAPRSVEIAPNDVIWSNMSIKWWEKYIRIAIVVGLNVGLIILYAVPVSFTGALSQISVLASEVKWLHWLDSLPGIVITIIQGVLPPALLSLVLILVPIVLRLLVKQQGVPTNTEKELGVQQYYFLFLFIQVFVVVSLSSSLTSLFASIYNNPTSILDLIANDLPSASGYFFSYLTVQALSNSASALLQVGTLIEWFLLGPLLDGTPRKKWHRQTSLQNVKWGSYFPPFTNFAVIGIIFSIIDPLILIFNLITFSLFWFVQRYNVIYVNQPRVDTGGLLFPKAIDQLFAGLYVLELCLIGLYFIQKNDQGDIAGVPQAIIMIVAMVGTITFQVLLNSSFKPLLRYLPITLEDDAVIRDEEFARMQATKWHDLTQEERAEHEMAHIEQHLEDKERLEEEQERAAVQAERDQLGKNADSQSRSKSRHNRISVQTRPKDDSWKRRTWNSATAAAKLPIRMVHGSTEERGRSDEPTTTTATADFAKTSNGYSLGSGESSLDRAETRTAPVQRELESQKLAGDILFSGFSDELEDLTPEERDTLVRYSFQHEALRARRPVVWIPRDSLGVSDDEIARSKLMSTVEVDDEEGQKSTTTQTYIWMSNEGTALDAKGKVVFRKSPPDFSSVDLIQL